MGPLSDRLVLLVLPHGLRRFASFLCLCLLNGSGFMVSLVTSAPRASETDICMIYARYPGMEKIGKWITVCPLSALDHNVFMFVIDDSGCRLVSLALYLMKYRLDMFSIAIVWRGYSYSPVNEISCQETRYSLTQFIVVPCLEIYLCCLLKACFHAQIAEDKINKE